MDMAPQNIPYTVSPEPLLMFLYTRPEITTGATPQGGTMPEHEVQVRMWAWEQIHKDAPGGTSYETIRARASELTDFVLTGKVRKDKES